MVIKGYDIKSEIYRGPVTTVYDAIHLALGRRVVLKVLNKQWVNERDLIDRFRREAKICARLDHPNIVKIFDFNSSGENIYISMEYIDGLTLEEQIQEDEKISFPEILRITRQILKGLSFAHQEGIIHRDIKPSNIIISPGGLVKITDFGLAFGSDLPAITTQEQSVGSPAYMSPEQALGNKLDQRSDLFSLGVSIYKVITKRSPFEAETIGATIQNVLSKKVDNLTNAFSEIPNWFSDLIDSMLAKDPKDRPVSADEILKSIQFHFDAKDNTNPAGTSIDSHMRQMNDTPVVTGSKFKYQFRKLVWILPVITFLAYLIYSQTNIGNSDNTAVDKISTSLKNIEPHDTVFPDTIKNKSKEKNLKESNVKTLIAGTPVSDRKIPDRKDGLADTIMSSPAIEKSYLYIIAKPWADIYIDNIYYEETPLNKAIMIDPGTHFIELKNPNYITYSKYHELKPAQKETLVVELDMNVGFLDIRIIPWAKIYIDGEYRETSPIEKPLALKAGERIVTLKNPNFNAFTDTIQVSSGKTIEKNFSFLK